MSKDVELRLKERGMTISLTDEVKDKLAIDGYKRAYGARPMRRAIQKLIEEPISEELINGNIKDGDKLEGYLEFDKEFPKEKDYSEADGVVTDSMKEADERQALIKAKIKFRSLGTYTEEEQEELKKSTIKKKKKSLGMSSTGSKPSSPSKDPVTGTA